MSIEDEVERSIVKAVMFSGSEEFLKNTSDIYMENISTLRRILPADVEPSLSFLATYRDDAGIREVLACVLGDQIVFVWRSGLFRRREYRVLPFVSITDVDYYLFSEDSDDPSVVIHRGQNKVVLSIPRESALLPEKVAQLLQKEAH
ncbi:MAG: hypothetical protein QM705_09445 [Ancrocorticia sp.]